MTECRSWRHRNGQLRSVCCRAEQKLIAKRILCVWRRAVWPDSDLGLQTLSASPRVIRHDATNIYDALLDLPFRGLVSRFLVNERMAIRTKWPRFLTCQRQSRQSKYPRIVASNP